MTDTMPPIAVNGVVITFRRQPGRMDAWVARAGGRSTIAGAPTAGQIVERASARVRDLVPALPEVSALWINDTTHWLAAQRERHPSVRVERVPESQAWRWTLDGTAHGLVEPTELDAWLAALRHASRAGSLVEAPR